MPISIIPNTLFLGISDAIIVGWGIIMTTALLVGNGFTSQLIPEYSNNYMMKIDLYPVNSRFISTQIGDTMH